MESRIILSYSNFLILAQGPPIVHSWGVLAQPPVKPAQLRKRLQDGAELGGRRLSGQGRVMRDADLLDARAPFLGSGEYLRVDEKMRRLEFQAFDRLAPEKFKGAVDIPHRQAEKQAVQARPEKTVQAPMRLVLARDAVSRHDVAAVYL